MARRLKDRRITIPVTAEEFEWVAHAASLNGISVREYVVRAINQRLVSQGVDAVLLAERCDQ
jgi:hypothetical protein